MLGVAVWGDGVQQRVSALKQNREELSREVAKMKAKVELKKKIDDALAAAKLQQGGNEARSFVAAPPEVLVGPWQQEIQSQAAALKIADMQATAVEVDAKNPIAPALALDLTFTAIPQQVVELVKSLTETTRLQRVTELDLDVGTAAPPYLSVRMRVVGMYFPPAPKPGSKTGVKKDETGTAGNSQANSSAGIPPKPPAQMLSQPASPPLNHPPTVTPPPAAQPQPTSGPRPTFPGSPMAPAKM